MLYDARERQLGNIVEILHKQWNTGKLPSQPGEYGWFLLTKERERIEHEGSLFEVNIQTKIVTKSRLYFGELQIIDIKGFRDELTGAILTNGFTTDWLDAKKVEREWREIASQDEIAVTPLLTVTAIDIYDIP